MHLVSCRHSTSGRADLRNLATMSMRRRTELIFHVVRENRMRAAYYHGSRRGFPPLHRKNGAGVPFRAFCFDAFSSREPGPTSLENALIRGGDVVGEVDLEEAGVDLLGGVQIVDRNRGVVALRV